MSIIICMATVDCCQWNALSWCGFRRTHQIMLFQSTSIFWLLSTILIPYLLFAHLLIKIRTWIVSFQKLDERYFYFCFTSICCLISRFCWNGEATLQWHPLGTMWNVDPWNQHFVDLLLKSFYIGLGLGWSMGPWSNGSMCYPLGLFP